MRNPIIQLNPNLKLQAITKSPALATAFALPAMAQAEEATLDEVRAIA